MERAMPPQTDRDSLRESFVLALLEAVRPLQKSADPELTFEVLIEAAGVLQQRLSGELAELRIEETD
jgi:hypothetical protein